MKEFIDKLIERLKERHEEVRNNYLYGKGNLAVLDGTMRGIEDAHAIIKSLEKEYKGGWISTDVDLPKENGWYWGFYVTSSYIGTDGVKHTECKYASIYWEDNLWLHDPRSFRTVDEVIAWKPIAPYTEGE